MEEFVFPNGLRYGDVILVEDEYEASTVLQAFQDLGWTWNIDSRPLDIDCISNIRGISVWPNNRINYCTRATTEEDLHEMYQRILKASDIFPNLKSVFDFSLLRDGLTIVVDNKEQAAHLLSAFKTDGWSWGGSSSGLPGFSEAVLVMGALVIESVEKKRLSYWTHRNMDYVFSNTDRDLIVNYYDLIIEDCDDDFKEINISDFLLS